MVGGQKVNQRQSSTDCKPHCCDMNNEDAGDLAAARHEAASSISASSPSATPNSSASRPHRKAYTGRSGRELSTSAAKRQSVMALGSIKHLQHMYAKTGLASNSP